MMKVATFTGSVQVSGVRCQQLKATRWIGVAHEMDFLSPVVKSLRLGVFARDNINSVWRDKFESFLI
jgi:hypothetical protein